MELNISPALRRIAPAFPAEQATMTNEASQNIVRLLTLHHNALYRYIYALLGDADQSNDVLQETSVALFEKADQFDESRPFLPWAYKFAYLHVLKWRAKQTSQTHTLDDDVLELVAKNRESNDSTLQRQSRHLLECMRLLEAKDQKAIQYRYVEAIPPDQAALILGFSRRTLYRELERIRRVLMNCIETKLAAEDA